MEGKDMRKTQLIIIISVICGILLAGMYYMNTANKLTKMRNLAKRYESDVQTELQTRFEKVPNLVEIVMASAQQEKDIIASVTEARKYYNNAFSIGDTAKMLEADAMFKTAITRFEEKYPDIASMEMFKGLMDEYSGLEQAINIARRNYNEVVMQYNNMVEELPTSIIANSRGFERIPEFKASEEANKPVEIHMTN